MFEDLSASWVLKKFHDATYYFFHFEKNDGIQLQQWVCCTMDDMGFIVLVEVRLSC